jgi:hypothetical protein
LYVLASGYAPQFTEPFAVDTFDAHIVLHSGRALIGEVLDADTAEPLNRVRILAKHETLPVEPLMAQSDERGQFVFPALAFARYLIDVDSPPLVLLGGPKVVELAPGEGPQKATLFAKSGGAVMGRVVDNDTRDGVPEVVIAARPLNGGNRVIKSKPADADGYFEVTGLGEGVYRLSPVGTPAGYASGLQAQLQVFVSAGETLNGLEIVMESGVCLSGMVLDSDGNPAGGAEVRGTSPGWQDQMTTNDDGQFVLGNCTVGAEVTLYAESVGAASRKIGPVRVPAEGLSGLTLELTIHRDASLAGQVVTTSGMPIEAQVAVLPDDSSRDASPSFVESDREGRFVFPSLVAGAYTMQAKPKSGTAKSVGTIRLAPGQSIHDLRLVYDAQELLTITGMVSDRLGNPVRAGIRISRQEENVYLNQGFCTSRHDGTFEAINLEPGTYSLEVSAAGYSSDKRPGVMAGSREVNFVLENCSRIRGHVIDENRQPIRDFQVAVVGGSYTAHPSPRPRNVYTRCSNPDGAFEFDVEPGRYRVLARAHGFAGGETTSRYLGPGQTSENLEIILQKGEVRIEGTVVSASGGVVPGTFIFVGEIPSPIEERLGEAIGRSDSTGAFALDGLAQEPTYVSAYHPEYGIGLTWISPRIGATTLARIQLATPSSVEGIVTLAGQALPDAIVTIRGEAGIERVTTTDEGGRFRAVGLPAGRALVQVQSSIPNLSPIEHELTLQEVGTVSLNLEYGDGAPSE